MNELKALFTLIPFWFYEKFKLRKWHGKGRASNLSYPNRNDAFYKSLEKEILPLLINNKFRKINKRRFIKDENNNIFFIEFDLTKKRNGMKVGYGKIQMSEPFSESILSDLPTLMNSGQFGKNIFYLKPPFWEYDYEYPIEKTDKKDTLMINEIVKLIKDLIIKD